MEYNSYYVILSSPILFTVTNGCYHGNHCNRTYEDNTVFHRQMFGIVYS